MGYTPEWEQEDKSGPASNKPKRLMRYLAIVCFNKSREILRPALRTLDLSLIKKT
jgi:hypothetical protein